MTVDSLLYVQGLFCGTLLLLSVGTVAIRLAFRLAPAASVSARWVAVLLVAVWLLMSSFHLLAAFHLFRIWVAIPLWAAAGAVAVNSFRRNREELHRLRSLLSGTSTALTEAWRAFPIMLSVSGALVLIRLLRGLAAPPLAWDMLTYHLVKVARWIRTGALAPEPAPDRWDGYEYFPYNGDSLWAWAVLPFHGDAALAFASALTWAAILLAAYAVIRELGGSRRSAILGALALGFLPGCFNFLTSGYVENLSVFLFLGSSLFACRLLSGNGTPSEAVLTLGGFSAGAGVKASGLPLLFVGTAAVVIVLLRRPGHRLALVNGLAAGILALAVGAPPYVRAWLERGSPVYPLSLRIAGRTIATGHQETELAVAGKLYRGMDRFTWDGFVHDLLHPRSDRDFLNPGWGGVLLLLGGSMGAIVALVGPKTRLPAAFLLVSAAIVVWGLLTPETLGLRTRWSWIIGRFLLPALAVFAVLGAAFGGGAAALLLRAAVGLGWFYGFPRGLSLVDMAAGTRLAGILLVTGSLAAWLMVLARRGSRRTATIPAAVVLAAVFAVLWSEVRNSSRYAIYEAAAVRRTFDLHPFLTEYGSAWALWQRLDGASPHRVAVAAGWNFLGDNWLIYPFFGSRLQNQVSWVPPTADGALIDYRLARASLARFDAGAWVNRLLEREIDSVVLLWPRTVEDNWVRALPELFEPVVVSADGKNALYRIRRQAARDWLARGAPLPPLAIDIPPERPS